MTSLPDGGEAGSAALDGLYGDLLLPAGTARRPHVAIGMVSSADGAASILGKSGGLGGAADRVAFSALRSACDVILVGAGTVRAEDYGPPSAAHARVERRTAHGLAPRPLLVVVTGSADLDPTSRLFGDASYRPLIATTDEADVGELTHVADVLRCGRGRVDLGALLAQLGSRGLRRVLCEGGPHLNNELVASGLVDELYLTIAPTLVGGTAPRPLAGEVEHPTGLALTSVVQAGSELLLRYRVLRDHDAA